MSRAADPGTAGRGARIAIVHYTAPPVIGGVEAIVGRHAALMADAGHTVRIVAGRGAAPDGRIEFRRVERADSVHPEVLAVAAELADGRVTLRFESLEASLETEMAAAIADSDMVIVHNVASMNPNLALTTALRHLAARPGSPPFILWHHDLAWLSPRYHPTLHDGEPWSLLRTAWPVAAHVTISETRRRDLTKLMGIPESSVEVIPGGVDLPTLPRRPGLGKSALEGVVPQGPRPLLLTPARVTPRKNLELAIEAVWALTRAGHPAGLVVTGPVDPHDRAASSYLDRLLDLRHGLGLDSSVRLLAESGGDAPTRVQLDCLYDESDVLFLPSRDEGFGLPMLEAAVHGLPIVCSDLPALRELGGEDAFYIEPGADPYEAAAAVLEAVERGPSEPLADRIADLYAWPRIYERAIAPLLRRVLSETLAGGLASPASLDPACSKQVRGL